MNAQRALRDLSHTPNGRLFFTAGGVMMADLAAEALGAPTSEYLPGGSVAAAHRIWSEQGPNLSTDTLVWADAGFCDLLEAAALGLREQAAADGIFRSEEFDLLAPSGTLYLSRPIELVRRHEADPRTYRRLDWNVDGGGTLLKVMAIGDRPEDRGRTYKLGVPEWTLGSIKGVGYGWTAPAITPIGTDMEVPAGDNLSNYHSTFLVLALASLARSKHVLDEPAATRSRQSRPPTGPGSQNQGEMPGVRRISLTRPEIGRLEVEAARPGASRRAHWVRGHWRRQWYATVEEHRMRWVDGHMRGDPAIGLVTGERVLIARQPKSVPA